MGALDSEQNFVFAQLSLFKGIIVFLNFPNGEAVYNFLNVFARELFEDLLIH